MEKEYERAGELVMKWFMRIKFGILFLDVMTCQVGAKLCILYIYIYVYILYTELTMLMWEIQTFRAE